VLRLEKSTLIKKVVVLNQLTWAGRIIALADRENHECALQGRDISAINGKVELVRLGADFTLGSV
jgi:hypothetical protein